MPEVSWLDLQSWKPESQTPGFLPHARRPSGNTSPTRELASQPLEPRQGAGRSLGRHWHSREGRFCPCLFLGSPGPAHQGSQFRGTHSSLNSDNQSGVRRAGIGKPGGGQGGLPGGGDMEH